MMKKKKTLEIEAKCHLSKKLQFSKYGEKLCLKKKMKTEISVYFSRKLMLLHLPLGQTIFNEFLK